MENQKKASIALSVFWAFLCMPLAVKLNQDEFGNGTFLLIFSYLCILSPLWIIWGCRWLISKTIPYYLFGVIAGITILLTYCLDNELTLLPTICFLILVVLDSVLGGKFKKPIIATYKAIKKRKWIAVLPLLGALALFVGYKRFDKIKESFTGAEAIRIEKNIKAVEEYYQYLRKNVESDLSFNGYSPDLKVMSAWDITAKYFKMTKLQKGEFVKEIEKSVISFAGEVKSVSSVDGARKEMEGISNVKISKRLMNFGTISTTIFLRKADALKFYKNDEIKIIGTLDRFKIGKSYNCELHMSKVKVLEHRQTRN